MASFQPFRALRPRADLASEICAPPYDVMSADEARAMARGRPLSFLHVSRPEIDLPEDVDPYSDAVYAQGREAFRALIDQGALRRDPEPRYYFYRQTMGAHSQIGLAGLASCAEYRAGVVKKHESTRPKKETDRVRHIEALNAQTGLVFLTYRARASIDAIASRIQNADPDVRFVADDGVEHAAWTVADADDIRRIGSDFSEIPSLYIADGHHRGAAASRIDERRAGASSSGWFLSVAFPHDQMNVLPYNRAVRDLNGLSPSQFIEALEGPFVIDPDGAPSPSRRHEVSCYIAGRWHSLSFRPSLLNADDPAGQLDVALLQKHALDPLLGIEDPRTDERVDFIGGVRGAGHLKDLVDAGRFAVAFSMYPTRVEDLMEIADGGGLMPPKSTWFEPKLRDAMFCHPIGD